MYKESKYISVFSLIITSSYVALKFQNSVDPDQLLQKPADLVLHCLQEI